MRTFDTEPVATLVLPVAPTAAPTIEQDILSLFDAHAPALLRYVASHGLNTQESEDLVQEVFLLLFRHLTLGRPRDNLRGWLFQVAHNLTVRRRRRLSRQMESAWDLARAARQADPSPDPETRVAQTQRHRRLQSVLRALPERDRACLSMRADGLRYRDIARALSMSLGAVAKSLTRSMARFVRADQR